MASNDILDAELRRETNRSRFGTSLTRNNIRPTAQELSRSLPAIISGYDWENLTQGDLNELTIAIRKEFRGTWSTMWADITAELVKMGEIEAQGVLEVYEDFVPDELQAPRPAAVASAQNNTVLTLTTDSVTSGTWAQFMSENTDATSRRVVGTIVEGFRNGSTLQEMLIALRGRYDRRTRTYVGGVLNDKAVRGAEALARTGVSHYANASRDAFAAANKKVIQGRILFATLDNRTTTICFGRHLNFYPTGERYPPLPFHYNERSQYIFKTEGFDPLNTERPAVGGQEGEQAQEEFEAKQARTNKKVRHRGRKDTDIFDVEQISAKTTADAWLRRQPRWFIESTLGKERARLFIDGGLKIDRFTDMLGRELTLEELIETNAGDRAYRRANR